MRLHLVSSMRMALRAPFLTRRLHTMGVAETGGRAMQTVRVHNPGPSSALKVELVEPPQPRGGEILVKNCYAGVNFIDTYFREGKYTPPSLPFTVGLEGGGYVEAIGEGEGSTSTSLSVGQRVVYPKCLSGSYAEFTTVSQSMAVPVPDALTLKDATACMIQGMTAHYLTHSTYPLKEGTVVLLHAAAGGTGRLIAQLARNAGAFIIGTCSSEEKAEEAKAVGCDEVVVYTRKDFVKEVNEITGGRGVNVVYDGVGRATFLKGFDCLRPRGLMVLFGAASGTPDPIDPALLQEKGSLFLTRPNLFHYIAERKELTDRAKAVFGLMKEQKLKIGDPTILPLQDAREAHNLLEERRTTGKILLSIAPEQ